MTEEFLRFKWFFNSLELNYLRYTEEDVEAQNHRSCLFDNWKPSFLPPLIFNWRTFSRQVTVHWSHGWAKNQVLTNQNSRNSWYQIVRWTICSKSRSRDRNITTLRFQDQSIMTARFEIKAPHDWDSKTKSPRDGDSQTKSYWTWTKSFPQKMFFWTSPHKFRFTKI